MHGAVTAIQKASMGGHNKNTHKRHTALISEMHKVDIQLKHLWAVVEPRIIVLLEKCFGKLNVTDIWLVCYKRTQSNVRLTAISSKYTAKS